MSDTVTDTPEVSEVQAEAGITEPTEVNAEAVIEAGQEESTGTSEETYTIKYNGEEIEVPLSELQNGYLRQSDYTRKNQEVARQREQLAELQAFNEAFQNNPEAVIRALAEDYGLTVAEQKALANELATDELDPYGQELQTLKAKIEAQEQQALQAQIIAEASTAIAGQNLDGVDPQGLISFAYEKQIGDLNTAAQLMAIQSQQEEAARKNAEIVANKRAASVVAGGSSSQRGTVGEADDPNLSFGQLFARNAAKAGL